METERPAHTSRYPRSLEVLLELVKSDKTDFDVTLRRSIATAVRTIAGLLLMLTGCVSTKTGTGDLTGWIVRIDEEKGSHPLAQVLVFVKSGLEGRTFPFPTAPVLLDQVDCTFVPRVFGIRVGQTLRVTSQDSSLHNVNCQPFNNPAFNESLFGGESWDTKFITWEVVILFQCNIHPQMRAHAGVFDHPFFAVTGDEGTFRFDTLPSGTYGLAAWHEEWGMKEAEVRVGGGKSATIEIRFP